MKTTIFLYLLAISVLVNAQDLKRKTISNMHFGEIYYVLKSNRSIRQGQYLKYSESMNMNDKAIDCFGNYDNNKRTGTWIFCDTESASNSLISIGEYMYGEKVGTWVYFYEPEDKNYFFLSGDNKHTKITLPTKDNEQFNVTVDTTGLRIAATGEYIDNKKSGIWSYYYKSGVLACRYNFSANIMIQNNGLETYDQLGGIERFTALFYKSVFEKRIKSQPFFSDNAMIVFELTTFYDSIEIEMRNSNGSAHFNKTMENILVKMPLEWINYDPRLEENKIVIQINYTVEGNIGTVKIVSIEPLK